MNKSISKKLFRITFILIISLFFLSFLFQILFFEDFYLHQKTENLKMEINRFKTLYAYQIDSKQVLESALHSYEEKNNSRVAIFSLDGGLIYLNNYKGHSEVKIEIEELKVLTAFCAELLSNEQLINDVITKNYIKTTIFDNKFSGTKKIGIVAPMSLQRENDSIIISVSSIQPIKEAHSVIKRFYFYLFIGFLIVVVILSKMYAKLISKPLVTINNVAKKMSNLDFEAKCEINSEDEIGNLATTLNFLSSNLNNALITLRQKNKQLEDEIEKERNLENMRKDFVDSVSHDLKTPIGIIGGYAEGIRDGIVKGEGVDIYVKNIIDEAYRMNELVTTMLEISNLESENISLNIESFNIIRLIKNMNRKFSLKLENKNLTVNYVSIPEYAYVDGDILKIERVIQNLLTNAIKYTSENNNINISILDNETFFEISIENEGSFIPQDELNNIYAKFYKLDKSGDRTKNSYGLGLSIIKLILDLHKSDYSISNSEKGVVFIFNLKKSELDDDF